MKEQDLQECKTREMPRHEQPGGRQGPRQERGGLDPLGGVAVMTGSGSLAAQAGLLTALASSSPTAASRLCRQVQRCQGNRYLQKVAALAVHPEGFASAAPPLPQAILENLGAEEEEPLQGAPHAFMRENDSRQSLAAVGPLRAHGPFPRVFFDNGKTGSAQVHWGGGGGGRGNQPTGSVTEALPVIETREPESAGGTAKAWVRPGTGTASVTRSYVGVLTGANGPNYYITAAGSTRIDRHEQLHTNTSKALHDGNIKPMEQTVARYAGEGNALSQGATGNDAKTALENIINWGATITAFRTQDTAANTPYGTVDTTELAAADYVHDYGPQTVGGVNYAHYIDVSPGPAPAPAAGP